MYIATLLPRAHARCSGVTCDALTSSSCSVLWCDVRRLPRAHARCSGVTCDAWRQCGESSRWSFPPRASSWDNSPETCHTNQAPTLLLFSDNNWATVHVGQPCRKRHFYIWSQISTRNTENDWLWCLQFRSQRHLEPYISLVTKIKDFNAKTAFKAQD